MPVDSNIALAFRAPQIESPVNMMAQMQQLQGGRQANELRAMQMDEMRADREQQNALAQFMRGYQPGVTDDRQALAYGAPGARAFTSLSTAARDRATEERNRAQAAASNIKVLRDILPSVTPESFPQWQATATAMLPQFAQMFEGEYSPERVRQLITTADRFLAQEAEAGRIQAFPANSTLVQGGQIVGQAAPPPARAFSVRGGVYDPERGFLPSPGAAAGGGAGSARAAGGGAIGPGGQKAPVGYRWAEDGSLAFIPGGPADPSTKPAAARAAGAVVQQEEGRAALGELIDSMQSLYGDLNTIGGMTSTKKGLIANAPQRIMSSGAGMLAGSFNPGEAQALRENIKNARPMLLQGIKQATGLTSGQLNSNVELQLWLSSVTDPTQPFETVQYTLRNLDKILVTDPAVRAANWRQIKGGQRGPSASGAITPSAAPIAPALPALPSGFRVD